jgi:hypothetical protein
MAYGKVFQNSFSRKTADLSLTAPTGIRTISWSLRPALKLVPLLFLSALLAVFGILSPVHSFKAGQRNEPSSHDVITRATIDMFISRYSGMLDFSAQMGGKKVSQWITEGVLDAEGLDETDAQDQETGTYLNHFHVPDVTRSSNGENGLKSGVDALEWVFGDNQSNRFRWKEAVHDYRLEGNRHQGFYALGHCLHVLQDMAAPPNVRQDSYGIDSPFDAYSATKGSVPVPPDVTLPPTGDPRELMEILSGFTNAGFFSTNTTRRSLDWSFPHPHPLREEIEISGDRRYRTLKARDLAGREYRLARVSILRSHTGSTDLSNPSVPHVLSADVMEDYYNILSVEAVRYGCVLIRDFINYATVVLEQVGAGDITTSTITLRWQKNIDPDFLSYSVFRSVDGVAYTLRTTITDQNTVSWTDSMLPGNSIFRYRVNVKFRSDNVQGVSNIVSARTGTAGDSGPPSPTMVSALDDITLEIQFNEPVARDGAENTDNYFITGGTFPVTPLHGSLGDDGRTLTLTTTSMHEGDAYLIRIQGIMDLSGNVMTVSSTLQFTGVDPPKVMSAQALSSEAIEVLFSEAITTASAQSVGNYVIYPYIGVEGATLETGGGRVRLKSSRQSPGIRYTLTVENITDLNGHVIGTGNSASFQGGF